LDLSSDVRRENAKKKTKFTACQGGKRKSVMMRWRAARSSAARLIDDMTSICQSHSVSVLLKAPPA